MEKVSPLVRMGANRRYSRRRGHADSASLGYTRYGRRYGQHFWSHLETGIPRIHLKPRTVTALIYDFTAPSFLFPPSVIRNSNDRNIPDVFDPRILSARFNPINRGGRNSVKERRSWGCATPKASVTKR